MFNLAHTDIDVIQAFPLIPGIRVQSTVFNYTWQIIHVSYVIYARLIGDLILENFDGSAPVVLFYLCLAGQYLLINTGPNTIDCLSRRPGSAVAR